MKLVYTCSVFYCLAILLSSCQKSPNGGVPFYVRMDSVSIADPIHTGQKTNPQGVTDVWVETNATNLGAYELPANFPVLQDGPARFVVSGGVWESGQSTVRDIYPFFDADTFTLAATATAKYTHHPSFTYKKASLFACNGDFEFNSEYDTVMHRVLRTDSNFAYYGRYCGQITATTTDTDRISVQNISAYTLPAGQEIWMELDYKSDVPFWVGLVGNTSGSFANTQVLFLLPITYWNKVYIKLSNVVGNLRANSYQIYFEAITPTGGSAGSVYVDNVRIVHF